MNNKSPRPVKHSHVQLCARKIYFEMDEHQTIPMVGDFVVREIDETVPSTGVPAVSVELDAGISVDYTVKALRRVIAAIEADGLPETTEVISRSAAALTEKMIQANYELNVSLYQLPRDKRERVLESIIPRQRFNRGQRQAIMTVVKK